MIPDPPLRIVIGYWAFHVAARRVAVTRHRSSPPATAEGCPLRYRPGDFPPIALHALCDFGRNVLIKAF
jgi:hypothetical protein